MREQIEKDITSQIDDIVKAQIAACLQEHIPRELQAEVDDSKQELERARLSLHNSYVHPFMHYIYLWINCFAFLGQGEPSYERETTI